MKRITWIFFIIIFACSGEIEPIQEHEKIIDTIEVNELDTISKGASGSEKRLLKNSDREGFLSFYNKFTQSIIQTDLDAVNKYIHPDGLYFIETDGAMPLIKKVFDAKAFSKTSKPTTFFNLGFDGIEKQLVFDVLPKVICDTTIYDKQGCFAQEINPLLESRIWNYASLNEKQIQAIEFLAETVNITVVNTSNFTFYFSKIESKWYLTFLDIRVPCSA